MDYVYACFFADCGCHPAFLGVRKTPEQAEELIKKESGPGTTIAKSKNSTDDLVLFDQTFDDSPGYVMEGEYWASKEYLEG